ncbi:uncharacterized protein B0H64DRAFT_187524 [Chaetomium fimeti]|uniref:MARVEL domain-containing protein n=1 Tax=Chaetomium fimeti TaxID=1854472 RepID=A0AAE0LQS0_9PEZI|nr:hypothetical protein B0H64DRAFT_187524 [Chaetomium fimeti]
MAGDDSSATEPKIGESSRVQENAHSENGGDQRQPERGVQEDTETQPSPPLPPRPLPAAHQELLKHQHQPPLPPPHAAQFAHLPVEQPYDERGPERPYYPRWHKTKLALLLLSLVVSAVIFGVGIALGFHNAPYYRAYYYTVPIDYELGLSGTTAGLAVVVTVIEFLKTMFSHRRQGMHPGALVAFHLIIWLMAVAAVVLTGLFAESYASDWYDYPRADRIVLHSQSQVYEQVLMGFVAALLFIHFVLFIGACVETNRAERANKEVVVVRVPVQVGAGYQGAGGHYPVYGPPGAYPAPFPAAQMTQIPTAAGAGTGPAPPQPAALYAGYYAPTPENAASQRQSHHGPIQGYYTPAPAPTTAAPREQPRASAPARPAPSSS